MSLTIAGQSIEFTELSFARTTAGGVAQTQVTLTGGRFAVTSGSTNLLSLSNIAGSLTIASTGLAGRLSASVSSDVTGFPTASSFALAVNTGASALGDLPAGPYLRVEVTGATFSVGGQTLSADVSFQRGVDAAGATVLRRGAVRARQR